MTKDQAIAARRDLTELGYLEKTGELLPDREGRLQPVYRFSTLGRIADAYVRQGLTFEAAMAKAKAQRN